MNNCTRYIFIDAQNLILGLKIDVRRKGKLLHKGWEIDLGRFYKYLQDKYKPEEVFLFIGKIKGREKFYKQLSSYGYTLIFKPAVKYVKNGKIVYKGNVDVELSVYTIYHMNDYDKAIVVTGDGDFRCLLEVLDKEGKLDRLLIPNKNAYSFLLMKFIKKADFLSEKKSVLCK